MDKYRRGGYHTEAGVFLSTNQQQYLHSHCRHHHPPRHRQQRPLWALTMDSTQRSAPYSPLPLALPEFRSSDIFSLIASEVNWSIRASATVPITCCHVARRKKQQHKPKADRQGLRLERNWLGRSTENKRKEVRRNNRLDVMCGRKKPKASPWSRQKNIYSYIRQNSQNTPRQPLDTHGRRPPCFATPRKTFNIRAPLRVA